MADHLISGHALAIKVDKLSLTGTDSLVLSDTIINGLTVNTHLDVNAATSSFNDIQTTTITTGDIISTTARFSGKVEIDDHLEFNIDGAPPSGVSNQLFRFYEESYPTFAFDFNGVPALTMYVRCQRFNNMINMTLCCTNVGVGGAASMFTNTTPLSDVFKPNSNRFGEILVQNNSLTADGRISINPSGVVTVGMRDTGSEGPVNFTAAGTVDIYSSTFIYIQA